MYCTTKRNKGLREVKKRPDDIIRNSCISIMYSVLLLLGYSTLSISVVLLYFLGVFHRLGVIAFIDKFVHERCPSLKQYTTLPRWVLTVLTLCYHGVVLGCHLVAINDILPYIDQEKSKSLINMPALMYHIWAIHTFCYVMCVVCDPGVVTQNNCEELTRVYNYDGHLFQPEAVCKTCDSIKPARSKHCKMCNRCLHRFDHHCTWINCCIGAYNYRYFIGILITGIIMCCNGVTMTLQFFNVIYDTRQLHRLKYIDSYGQKRELGGIVLAQYQFYHFPRQFLLASTLFVLAVLLTLFTIYHIGLIAINRTTNESHKLGSLSTTKALVSRRFYHRGILSNVLEVLVPLKPTSLDKQN